MVDLEPIFLVSVALLLIQSFTLLIVNFLPWSEAFQIFPVLSNHITNQDNYTDKYVQHVNEMSEKLNGGLVQQNDENTLQTLITKLKSKNDDKPLESLRFSENKTFSENGLQDNESVDTVTCTPEPFMVLKTVTSMGMKIFVNICVSHLIPECSEKAKLTENGEKEEYGLNIPLSLSSLRPTKDKKGKDSKVCDIILNPTTLEDIRKDKTKEKRQILYNLCIEHMEKKFTLSLSRKFKFPCVRYKFTAFTKKDQKIHSQEIRKLKQPILKEVHNRSVEKSLRSLFITEEDREDEAKRFETVKTTRKERVETSLKVIQEQDEDIKLPLKKSNKTVDFQENFGLKAVSTKIFKPHVTKSNTVVPEKAVAKADAKADELLTVKEKNIVCSISLLSVTTNETFDINKIQALRRSLPRDMVNSLIRIAVDYEDISASRLGLYVGKQLSKRYNIVFIAKHTKSFKQKDALFWFYLTKREIESLQQSTDMVVSVKYNKRSRLSITFELEVSDDSDIPEYDNIDFRNFNRLTSLTPDIGTKQWKIQQALSNTRSVNNDKKTTSSNHESDNDSQDSVDIERKFHERDPLSKSIIFERDKRREEKKKKV